MKHLKPRRKNDMNAGYELKILITIILTIHYVSLSIWIYGQANTLYNKGFTLHSRDALVSPSLKKINISLEQLELAFFLF